MAKEFSGDGKSVKITGQSATIAQGSIFRRSGGTSRYWVGVVTDEIIGTAAAQTTVDGRPIQIGDGVAAEAQFGDGKGDMFVEGIFTLRVVASGMYFADSDPVYAQVASFANPGGTLVSSGVTNNQTAAFVKYAVSGALVGFAEGASYISTAKPYVGLNVVDVKLLGLPLHQLAAAAP